MTTEIEWRRRWKPDLRCCPWQPMKIDDEQYLIKFKFTHNSYELLVTDLKNFWYEELADNALKTRIKKLNPSIEASVTRVLDQIQNCLESQGKETSLSIGFKEVPELGGDKMMLKIKNQLAGMPFEWNFIGKPAESEMASENLIVPLLAMVGELTRRQKELVNVLERKDKEIDDYKSQGVKTSRKHIETNPFVMTAFENEMLMSKGFDKEVQHLGSSGFSEDCQDLYRQIMTKHAYMHRSPAGDIPENDSLNDEISEDGSKSSTGPSWGSSRLPPSLAGSKSPTESPTKSPEKSPQKTSSAESSPAKNTELLRKQALERRLEEEKKKKQDPKKKKKKMAF